LSKINLACHVALSPSAQVVEQGLKGSLVALRSPKFFGVGCLTKKLPLSPMTYELQLYGDPTIKLNGV